MKRGFMLLSGEQWCVACHKIIHFSKMQKLQCKISKFSSYFSSSKFALSIICR